MADDERPREEIDGVDGKRREKAETDVADLALRPAHADRVDAGP